MELHKIAVRVLFAYIFLLALLRISGNRTVSQGEAFDFVLALILGDMIDDLLWGEVPASQFVVGTATLVLTEVAVSVGSYRSRFISWLVEGEPRLIMRNGSLLQPPLKREWMNEQKAEEVLREKGLGRDRWPEVKSAWMEKSGEAGVLKQDWAKAAQKQDLDRVREVIK